MQEENMKEQREGGNEGIKERMMKDGKEGGMKLGSGRKSRRVKM